MACTSPEAVVFHEGKLKFLGHKFFLKGTQTKLESARSQFFLKFGVETIPMPCGSCMACRITYARDYALRGVCESQMSDWNYFVTLTYDEDNVPRSPSGALTLRKSDVRSFLVRLREVLGSGLRTLGCAEYGETTHRPHYHIIFFGKELTDLVPYSRSGNGSDILFESETVTRAWGMGRVLIGKANYTTISYVAGYVLKKVKGKNADSYYGDREHETLVAVTRNGGGIGSSWFDRFYNDIFSAGALVHDGRQFPVPRYFKLKLKAMFPDRYEAFRVSLKEKAGKSDRNEYTVERQQVKNLCNNKKNKERKL